MARTIWGTSTVFSTPPASRMYMLLGTVLAMVNISACRVPLPNRNTSSISRKNPITRDRAVPAAITALAEISRADSVAADPALVAAVPERQGSVADSVASSVCGLGGRLSHGLGPRAAC